MRAPSITRHHRGAYAALVPRSRNHPMAGLRSWLETYSRNGVGGSTWSRLSAARSLPTFLDPTPSAAGCLGPRLADGARRAHIAYRMEIVLANSLPLLCQFPQGRCDRAVQSKGCLTALFAVKQNLDFRNPALPFDGQSSRGDIHRADTTESPRATQRPRPGGAAFLAPHPSGLPGAAGRRRRRLPPGSLRLLRAELPGVRPVRRRLGVGTVAPGLSAESGVPLRSRADAGSTTWRRPQRRHRGRAVEACRDRHEALPLRISGEEGVPDGGAGVSHAPLRVPPQGGGPPL